MTYYNHDLTIGSETKSSISGPLRFTFVICDFNASTLEISWEAKETVERLWPPPSLLVIRQVIEIACDQLMVTAEI
jgi:hypothetical protein